jgi:hypothetical protein
MTAQDDGIPALLLHHFKHNQVLHERIVVLLTITSAQTPYVDAERRLALSSPGEGSTAWSRAFGLTKREERDRLLRHPPDPRRRAGDADRALNPRADPQPQPPSLPPERRPRSMLALM